MSVIAHTGAALFDGTRLLTGKVLLCDGPRVVGVADAVPPGAIERRWPGGTLMPGFVDLQVNGGGGVMLNDAPAVETVKTIAAAHWSLGTRAFLPTLITDTFAQSRAAIAAVEQARAEGVPGVVGLHLEGPHLSVARKGAHDPALIRAMDDADLTMLCDAVGRVGHLMLTVAPESVSNGQIAALSRAGVIVSLGHSDCSFDTACAAFDHGATCTTHLFNAMSGPASREPGLAGATLHRPVAAGLIADAVHVHPATIAAALRAKAAPGRVFLVTDAMAVAGSDADRFTLNGRTVLRKGGRLTLENGTLAGADLSMAQAIGVMTGQVGIALNRALAMATSVPADVLGEASLGHLAPGAMHPIHLSADGLVSAIDAAR